jgi:Family of unknown function (DUF6152)
MKQAIKVAGALAIVCGSLAGVQMVAAHHAMVMYDGAKTVTLDGTVLEFRWANPHVFLRVEGKTKDGGEPEVWLLETSSPVNLARLGTGWSETVFKPGDRISVEINPHREVERKEARLMKLTLVDTGQVFGTAYRGPPPPGPQ